MINGYKVTSLLTLNACVFVKSMKQF